MVNGSGCSFFVLFCFLVLCALYCGHPRDSHLGIIQETARVFAFLSGSSTEVQCNKRTTSKITKLLLLQRERAGVDAAFEEMVKRSVNGTHWGNCDLYRANCSVTPAVPIQTLPHRGYSDTPHHSLLSTRYESKRTVLYQSKTARRFLRMMGSGYSDDRNFA